MYLIFEKKSQKKRFGVQELTEIALLVIKETQTHAPSFE